MRESATVNYHVRSDTPQAFRFDVDGVYGKLVSPTLLPTQVSVQDLRDVPSNMDFNRDGIRFDRHISKITDFETGSAWQAVYEEELRALLVERIAAKEVIVFDHTVRVDDPDADRKPARNVHNDYSAPAAQQRLIDILGEERASEFQEGHYGFVNVWRPVQQTIRTSPLGFIRPSSVRPEDWMNIELIYPDRVGQILGVAANDDHDWFYLSKMTPQEVVIFNIHDNRGRPCLGHSALDMDSASGEKAVRKSIESRTLVRYQ
ncbi:CmcJ/NvfI family oxidoreductase [Granulosicoccus sp. 3-233]|uniref:CmcJ/NvfI family oxidoreductase n=1 Tax=Granulosicoccus sp. 3-233 TaxID=3417969 RepID=UPI003D34CEB6